MREAFRLIILVVLLQGTAVAQPPEPVVSLRQKILSKEAYLDLARQWGRYVEKNGDSAEAYVNIGQAYRYAGEPKEVFLEYYRKAVDADPRYARALDLYGCHLYHAGDKTNSEEAIRMLERARNLDPDYGEVLYSLFAIYCCEKRLGDAHEIAEDIFRRDLISRPLQDFGYNLLAGLPENAVLFTNGDNDTYPPISLQAGMGFREDVVILNQSLLGCFDYAVALREKYGDWFPRVDERINKGPFSTALFIIKELLKSGKRPVYVAITIPFDCLGTEKTLSIEGVCVRIHKLQGDHFDTDHHKTLELMESMYRLDSATNWSYPWDLKSAEMNLMTNYIAIAQRGAQVALEQGDRDTAERLVEIGMGIARFHKKTEMVSQLEGLIEE